MLSDGFGTGLALNSARVWRVWELQLYRFVTLSVIYLIKYIIIYISYKFYHIHSDSIFYFVFYWSCISYVIIVILVIFTISSLFIFGHRCVFAKLPMAVDNYEWQALIKCMEQCFGSGAQRSSNGRNLWTCLRHPSASFGILRIPRCSKAHHVGHMGSHWRKKGRHANCLETRFESWFPPQVKKKAPCSCLSISIWVLACQQKFGGVAYISQLPSGSTWALEASLPER